MPRVSTAKSTQLNRGFGLLLIRLLVIGGSQDAGESQAFFQHDAKRSLPGHQEIDYFAPFKRISLRVRRRSVPGQVRMLLRKRDTSRKLCMDAPFLVGGVRHSLRISGPDSELQ